MYIHCWNSSRHSTLKAIHAVKESGMSLTSLTVPWWHVHPQNYHVTFWPAGYVHPTFRMLWCFSTAIFWPCNILPLHYLVAVTTSYCIISPCHCVTTSTPFFYLDCDRMSTFALKRKCGHLSDVTRAHLEVIWLFWCRLDNTSQWSIQGGLMMGHHWCMDQLGACPILTYNDMVRHTWKNSTHAWVSRACALT
jgi:hypothetical protein